MMFDFFKRRGIKSQKITRSVRRSGIDSFAAAGEYMSLMGWNGDDGETINSKIFSDGAVMRARARTAALNNELVAGYLAKSIRNVIGAGGMRCEYRGMDDDPRYKELEKSHAEALRVHSMRKNFSVEERFTRTDMEELVVRGLIRDGEVFLMKVWKRGKFKLRMIDPARLATEYSGDNAGNRIVCGVEVDEDYAAVAYWFRDFKNNDRNYSNYWTYYGGRALRIPAKNVLHLFMPQYPTQVRGFSWLHPVLYALEQLRRYRDTAIKASRQGAANHIILIRGEADGVGPGEVVEEQTDETKAQEIVIDMSGDSPTVLEAGDDMKGVNGTYPHQLFDPFVEEAKRIIATGLDAAAPPLTNNWGGINFSAGQLMFHDERAKWERVQKFVGECFCDWWHDTWVNEAILSGQIDVNGIDPMDAYKYLSHVRWCGKIFPPVDEVKSANAAETRLSAGITSKNYERRRMNLDADQMEAEIMAEGKGDEDTSNEA